MLSSFYMVIFLFFKGCLAEKKRQLQGYFPAWSAIAAAATPSAARLHMAIFLVGCQIWSETKKIYNNKKQPATHMAIPEKQLQLGGFSILFKW